MAGNSGSTYEVQRGVMLFFSRISVFDRFIDSMISVLTYIVKEQAD